MKAKERFLAMMRTRKEMGDSSMTIVTFDTSTPIPDHLLEEMKFNECCLPIVDGEDRGGTKPPIRHTH